MREELEQKLMDRFSFMEARSLWYGDKLGFPVYCSCDDGWFNIIWELCEKIDIELNKLPKEYKENFYIIQIKEKYGTLRYYTSSIHSDISDNVYKVIDEAENKSSKTCEICGEPGKLRGVFWFKTLCEKHKEELGYDDIMEEL